MGAACVPNIRLCGGVERVYYYLNITWLHIVFRDVTVPTFTAWHGTCQQRRAARKSSWPGGVRYGHGAGRGWRGRGAPAVCSPAAADVCYWFCWVRRTSDSSTTTHSFLHHATKTQQQLNLETVGFAPAAGTLRGAQSGWRECPGSEGRMGGGDGRCWDWVRTSASKSFIRRFVIT